ncbi:MAG: 30S ribosomal protein S7 [Deltaproteobacteria bacterium]|nr:30S ribosomal protein S7 [Deltaproteobacteria bacterium]
MSRKGQAPKRKINPDPKFRDKTISKFINRLMWDGKKSVAEKVFYGCVDVIEEKTGEDGLKVFRQAMDNVKPHLEVRSRRVGGSNYQVPVEVRADRKIALAMRWIIAAARSRGEKSMEQRLAAELMDAVQKRGAAMKKREDVHKMAEANRAFSHFRW